MQKRTYNLKIDRKTNQPVLNVALNTLEDNKQALIFVNSKRSAESVAEKISKKNKLKESEIEELDKIANKALKVLSKPTKQCRRLFVCLKKGIAFHHSGLHSEQRKIIETNFKKRKIKIIVATPTLAQGVDLPAYRTIIRDLKRFTGHGMRYIPTLEYEQQAGRAGRPGQEKLGQSICFAKNKKDKKYIIENYINGEPEDIISKLAVEPVLRSYALSLISTEYCNSEKELKDFFSKTFFAHQFENMKELNLILKKTINNLDSWKFINQKNKISTGFVKASDLQEKDDKIRPTLLGKRISELYLDPYTANYIIKYLKNNQINVLSLLFMLSNCLELKPLLSVGNRNFEETETWFKEYEEEFGEESELMKADYFELMKAARTTMFMQDWINEFNEEQLLEKYNIRPGEINAKIEIIDWLIYAATEIARLENKEVIKDLIRLRIRIKNGCKEELIPLLKFKNIGRVRARKLFNENIRNVHDVKKVNYEKLADIIGKKIAEAMKKEVNIEIKDKQNKLI
jgi:helicase